MKIQSKSWPTKNSTSFIGQQKSPHVLKRIAYRIWFAIKNVFDSIRILFVRIRYGKLSFQYKNLMNRVALRKIADENLIKHLHPPKIIKDLAAVPEGMQDFYEQIMKFIAYKLEAFCDNQLNHLDKKKKHEFLAQANAALKEIVCRLLYVFAETDFATAINSIAITLQTHVKAISQVDEHQAKELRPLSGEAEEKAYGQLAERIYSILFPQQSIDVKGEAQAIDSLIYQIAKMKLNFSLNELFPSQLQAATKQASEQMLQTLISGSVQFLIASWLKSEFDVLIDPEQRDQLFLTHIFPYIQEQLLIKLVNTEIATCAKLFIDPQSDVQICQKMYQTTKKLVVQYKSEFDNHISMKRFQEIFTPEIKKIREKIAEDHRNNKHLTEASITESIKKFVEGPSEKNNTLFGNLAQAFLCDLGQFAAVPFFFLKRLLSCSISNFLGEYQKDYHALAKQITLQLKKQNDQLAKVPQKTQSNPNINLQSTTPTQEIEKTARLIFDFTQKKIQTARYGTVSLFQLCAKKTLGQDHHHLTQIIQRIYTKMFTPAPIAQTLPKEKDRITQSLLFKLLESILNDLQEGLKEVQKSTSHLPLPKMTQAPLIAPCL